MPSLGVFGGPYRWGASLSQFEGASYTRPGEMTSLRGKGSSPTCILRQGGGSGSDVRCGWLTALFVQPREAAID
jgi:hypothetical protein